jgi:predicted RNA polymerase sigma factor
MTGVPAVLPSVVHERVGTPDKNHFEAEYPARVHPDSNASLRENDGALYEVLLDLDDNPVIALNHAVAVSMLDGASAGLALLDELHSDPRVEADRRLHAVRGHLLERAGDALAAADAFRAARSHAPNIAQQRYLTEQIARLENAERSDERE